MINRFIRLQLSSLNSFVYELIDGKVIAENIGACTDCMACLDVCPTNAILNHSAW